MQLQQQRNKKIKSAMSGLSRTFVSEEDRGTVIFLQLATRPSVVYFGKLLFNLEFNFDTVSKHRRTDTSMGTSP